MIRADTATLQSVDYNAACVEKTVKDNVCTPWGWVGYSQGCANAFRAESVMLQVWREFIPLRVRVFSRDFGKTKLLCNFPPLQGTPEQQRLMSTFRCRQLLFSAANGSAHATCGDWKLLRALVDGERFLKRFQVVCQRKCGSISSDDVYICIYNSVKILI